MEWLKARLSERSTWTALVTLASLVMMHAGPEATQAASGNVAILSAILQACFREKGIK